MSRSLVPISEWANSYGISYATARNYIGRGFVTAYRVPGRRGALVDPAEANAAMEKVPRSMARATGYGSYGPQAQVITLTQDQR